MCIYMFVLISHKYVLKFLTKHLDTKEKIKAFEIQSHATIQFKKIINQTHRSLRNIKW